MYILSYKSLYVIFFRKLLYSNEFLFFLFSFLKSSFYLASLFRKFYNFYYVIFWHLFTMHTAMSLTIDFFLGKIMLRSRASREFSLRQNR